MADEAIITPTEEAKDGTVAKELGEIEVAPLDTPKKNSPETVPLAVYLELKDDLKSLKQEIKDSKESKHKTVAVAGLDELTKKYPDVSESFIVDMLNSATSEATRKIEEKYSPIIERQENEKKQAAFDKAFDNIYNKALQDNPDLPKTIDKELIKELTSTPKYRNIPVADILVKMYGVAQAGKPSSEDEARTGADKVDDVVDFSKITKDQKTAVMADANARTKYFAWLDKQI